LIACLLSNIYSKNYWNQTTVKIISGRCSVVYFFGDTVLETQCSIILSL